MTLPSHLVVKLGRKALFNKSKYKVNLKTPVGHVFEHMLETADDFAEMKYKNDGPEDIQYCDIEGDGALMNDDGSLDYIVGFGCVNFWIGYPQAVVSFTSGFNPNTDGADYHKFSQNETYSWTLEYSNPDDDTKWYKTYTMTRNSDTDAKEFVLLIDN